MIKKTMKLENKEISAFGLFGLNKKESMKIAEEMIKIKKSTDNWRVMAEEIGLKEAGKDGWKGYVMGQLIMGHKNKKEEKEKLESLLKGLVKLGESK